MFSQIGGNKRAVLVLDARLSAKALLGEATVVSANVNMPKKGTDKSVHRYART